MRIVGRNRRHVAFVAAFEGFAKPSERRQTGPHRQHDGQQRQRDHNQDRQAQTHLHLARDAGAMVQRFRHGDADRIAQRGIAEGPVGRGIGKTDPLPGGEIGGVGVMRLQQDPALRVCHQIGEMLDMIAIRAQMLGHALFVAVDDVHHRQRQQALCGLLERRIEHLVDFLAQHHGGDRGRGHPQHAEQQADGQAQAQLQAARRRHGVPSR